MDLSYTRNGKVISNLSLNTLRMFSNMKILYSAVTFTVLISSCTACCLLDDEHKLISKYVEVVDVDDAWWAKEKNFDTERTFDTNTQTWSKKVIGFINDTRHFVADGQYCHRVRFYYKYSNPTNKK